MTGSVIVGAIRDTMLLQIIILRSSKLVVIESLGLGGGVCAELVTCGRYIQM